MKAWGPLASARAAFGLPPRSWALALALVVLLLVVPACGRDEQGVAVSLREGAADPESAAKGSDELRVGIGCMFSASATADLYGNLVEELGRQIGQRGVTVLRADYKQINDLLEQGRLDCAVVCTGAYLAGRSRFGMETLVVPVFDGTPTYRSIVLAREDSEIARFEDFEGRKFAFVDPLSNTGCAYPKRRILDLGRTPEEFFHYQYTHAHDKSIEAVRRGLVDGAAVDELVFKHLASWEPEAVEGLKVIERSPPFGAPPVVINPSTNDSRRAALRQAFLDLRGTERGQSILEALRIDRFMAPPAGLYESAEAQAEAIREHTAKGGGR